MGKGSHHRRAGLLAGVFLWGEGTGQVRQRRPRLEAGV